MSGIICTVVTVEISKLRSKGAARVEVLLRQQALKPKSDKDGNKLSGEAAKSSLPKKGSFMKFHHVSKTVGGFTFKNLFSTLTIPFGSGFLSSRTSRVLGKRCPKSCAWRMVRTRKLDAKLT